LRDGRIDRAIGSVQQVGILSRFERDLASLKRVVDRVDRYAMSQKRAVTVPLIKQMLQEEGAGHD